MHRSALHAARMARRGLHTTRAASGGTAPWGTQVNEPGGRLFGEKVRAPGERRVPFDWELPYLGTLGLSAVILYFGLGARPNRDVNVSQRARAAAAYRSTNGDWRRCGRVRRRWSARRRRLRARNKAFTRRTFNVTVMYPYHDGARVVDDYLSPSCFSSSCNSAIWPLILRMSGCFASAASSCFFGATRRGLVENFAFVRTEVVHTADFLRQLGGVVHNALLKVLQPHQHLVDLRCAHSFLVQHLLIGGLLFRR